jgi:hypothetical protein
MYTKKTLDGRKPRTTDGPNVPDQGNTSYFIIRYRYMFCHVALFNEDIFQGNINKVQMQYMQWRWKQDVSYHVWATTSLQEDLRWP